MKYAYVLIAALVTMVVISCSTSLITSSWKASEAVAKPYKKVLVVGLSGEPDRNYREKMEQHLVGDLTELGYHAVASIAQFGPKAFENLEEKEAVKKLADSGFDAIITIVMLNKEKERYYTPARVYYSPYGSPYHRRFYNYYSTIYGRVYTPGYYTESTKFFWESNLYDLADGMLVYSAQSQSFDPTSASSLGHEYGLMIIKDMVKQGVLQKQTSAGVALKSF